MKASGLSIGVVIAIAVAIGTALYVSRPASQEEHVNAVYSNPTYGISFDYPKNYILTESELGNGERRHHQILLTTETDIPVNGEGPTAITIDFYQNDIDTEKPEDWVTNNSSSNFKLSPDGTLAPKSIAGVPGFAYRWSGLYEGESLVTEANGYIVMFSATHLTPEDPIRADFQALLGSVKFD